MEPTQAVIQLRERAGQIARFVTEMHPIVSQLRNEGAQNEIYRALFELTKQVEVVKKHLLRVEKQDESRLV